MNFLSLEERTCTLPFHLWRAVYVDLFLPSATRSYMYTLYMYIFFSRTYSYMFWRAAKLSCPYLYDLTVTGGGGRYVRRVLCHFTTKCSFVLSNVFCSVEDVTSLYVDYYSICFCSIKANLSRPRRAFDITTMYAFARYAVP